MAATDLFKVENGDGNSAVPADETYRQALEVVFWWEQAFYHFDPQRPPVWLAEYNGLDENRAKAFSMLLGSARAFANAQWPDDAFAAVQAAPVEACGEIESSAHAVVWQLAAKLAWRLGEALRPGSTRGGAFSPDFREDDYMAADWAKVTKVLRYTLDGDEIKETDIARLRVLLEQEHARAAAREAADEAVADHAAEERPLTQAACNDLVSRLLRKPAFRTCRALAAEIRRRGYRCSVTLVCNTPAWKAFAGKVKDGKGKRPQAVALTGAVAAVKGSDDADLEALITEQQADFEESPLVSHARKHRRSARV